MKSIEKQINVGREDSWGTNMVPAKGCWIDEFDQLSKKEGWALFDADGVTQIQAIDCPEEEDDGYLEGSDGEAYALVCRKALEGSKMHLLALFLDGRKEEWTEFHIPRCLVE